MMLASRRFKVMFFIVGILAIAVFSVYNVYGHNWFPNIFQRTSTSSTKIFIRTDDSYTDTQTCGTCYKGNIVTHVVVRTVAIITIKYHYHARSNGSWSLQYRSTSRSVRTVTNSWSGSCSNSGCSTNN